MIDIYSPQQIDITITRESNTISVWVNVDGKCQLRVKGINPNVLEVNYTPSDVLKAGGA